MASSAFVGFLCLPFSAQLSSTQHFTFAKWPKLSFSVKARLPSFAVLCFSGGKSRKIDGNELTFAPLFEFRKRRVHLKWPCLEWSHGCDVTAMAHSSGGLLELSQAKDFEAPKAPSQMSFFVIQSETRRRRQVWRRSPYRLSHLFYGFSGQILLKYG